jgi:hypothetical protein
MTMVIDGTLGITFPDTSRQYNSYYNFKNRIINGAMVIDQRNNGASVIPTTSYTLDRWVASQSVASKFSVQRNAGSVTPPVGFTNYLGVTSLSAYSSGAGDVFILNQYIEGVNTADFAWGTANATSIAVSFWVRSSLTGTFSLSICNGASNRSYITTYTVNAANTWEYKTVTIPGDTTGSWMTDSNISLQLRFDLGLGSNFNGTAGSWVAGNVARTSGSQSIVGTNGATFYITGVQLEEGIVSTPFDFRPYTTELQLCQRYYYQSWGSGAFTVTGNAFFGMPVPNALQVSVGTTTFPVVMRANPTVTLYDDVGSSGRVSQPGLANGLISTASGMGVSGFSGTLRTSASYTTAYPVSAGFIAAIEL